LRESRIAKTYALYIGRYQRMKEVMPMTGTYLCERANYREPPLKMQTQRT
jgi:hypothetical protein